jgi:hypothetical protein
LGGGPRSSGRRFRSSGGWCRRGSWSCYSLRIRGKVGWAREKVRSDEHLLALVLSLKCFQRLGYFPSVGETPEVATGRARALVPGGWGRAGACVRDGSHRAGCTGSWCAGGWGWFMIPSGHINNDPPKLAGDHRPISYQTLTSAHPLRRSEKRLPRCHVIELTRDGRECILVACMQRVLGIRIPDARTATRRALGRRRRHGPLRRPRIRAQR